MVVYNSPTRLAGCGLCGADEPDVAPVLPPIENEIAVASDPTQTVVAPPTVFDKQVAAALQPIPSWVIGAGVAAVALGVIAGVWAISRQV